MVDQKYEPYIDAWQCAIRTAYPEYDHMVVCIKSEKPFDAAVERLRIDPDVLFLSDCLHGKQHRYHYITDVDMLIFREPVDICAFHLTEMVHEGLSYSNTPRATEPLGPDRLTGLHFYSREWLAETEEARRQTYYDDTLGSDKFDDELMLMGICKNAGLKIPQKKPLLCRHHGIHLGTVRAFYNNRTTMRGMLAERITPELARRYVQWHNSFLAEIPEHEDPQERKVRRQLEALYAWCVERAC